MTNCFPNVFFILFSFQGSFIDYESCCWVCLQICFRHIFCTLMEIRFPTLANIVFHVVSVTNRRRIIFAATVGKFPTAWCWRLTKFDAPTNQAWKWSYFFQKNCIWSVICIWAVEHEFRSWLWFCSRLQALNYFTFIQLFLPPLPSPKRYLVHSNISF